MILKLGVRSESREYISINEELSQLVHDRGIVTLCLAPLSPRSDPLTVEYRQNYVSYIE